MTLFLVLYVMQSEALSPKVMDCFCDCEHRGYVVSKRITESHCNRDNKMQTGDLPDGPVAKTRSSQCRGPGFNP